MGLEVLSAGLENVVANRHARALLRATYLSQLHRRASNLIEG